MDSEDVDRLIVAITAAGVLASVQGAKVQDIVGAMRGAERELRDAQLIGPSARRTDG